MCAGVPDRLHSLELLETTLPRFAVCTCMQPRSVRCAMMILPGGGFLRDKVGAQQDRRRELMSLGGVLCCRYAWRERGTR